MNYQTYDYETPTDTTAPWMPTTGQSGQMIAAPTNGQLVATPAAPIVAANATDMATLGSMIQSVQQTQMQQVYLLREFDARVARLEQAVSPYTSPTNATASFERATWWAIWGLLMLILGGTLTIVIVLILMNIQFR